MLDRRQLPTPPRPVADQSQAVFWQDADGKIWRYVPLQVQLRDMLVQARTMRQTVQTAVAARGSLAAFWGAAITIASGWALGSHWPQAVVGARPLIAVVDIALLMLGAGLLIKGIGTGIRAGSLAAHRSAWQQRLADQTWLAYLVDDQLCALLTARAAELLPGVSVARFKPQTLSDQLLFTATQAAALERRGGHVEKLKWIDVVHLQTGRNISVDLLTVLGYLGTFLAVIFALSSAWPALYLGAAWLGLSQLGAVMLADQQLASTPVLETMLEQLLAE